VAFSPTWFAASSGIRDAAPLGIAHRPNAAAASNLYIYIHPRPVAPRRDPAARRLSLCGPRSVRLVAERTGPIEALVLPPTNEHSPVMSQRWGEEHGRALQGGDWGHPKAGPPRCLGARAERAQALERAPHGAAAADPSANGRAGNSTAAIQGEA